MESTIGDTVVDPEVRAHIYSLVSALGGTGADKDGRYVLGDDALACLKDIKRWLKLYDDKLNRLDVARCLAEANLVNGDLLAILAAWREEAAEDKLRSKIALACLELLVPLTWPVEKNDAQMTVNHHRHIPYLRVAQLSYKRGILEHDSSRILRTAVRTGLPSIALSMGERDSRDEGIIRLLLYFLRNVAMISTSAKTPTDWDESEVSRSATIEVFHHQDVLALLLTIASNMGEDFNIQDIVVMEVLFYLLKGIDPKKLFMNETQRNVKKADELQALITKEASMHRGYNKNAPTRHNRFGTMIWVKRDDDRVSTVSGQDILKDGQHTLSKMDQSKKWNRPKRHGKNAEQTPNDFDLPVPLTVSGYKHLRSFVEEFLDSGFNPLFSHIRKAIEREADRVLEIHSQQYFYLVSWFLEAERIRRKVKKEADQQRKKSLDEIFEADSFGLVASVLNQETFIILNRFMQDRLDMKLWQDVNAGMRCFTQILLAVQEMSESTLEEDQEIAENILNRIFYEETTHDRIIAILRGYKDQGFGYLDASTELSHVFLRMLERYSKENVDLQIRSKRRARKQKKAMRVDAGQLDDAEDHSSEAEEIVEAERVSKERKFDFKRFSSKFMTQSCINTFVALTAYYKDLNCEQLKRAHRFFYRVAFKQEMSVMLFRLDIISLLNRMINGPVGLDSSNPMYKEWDELTTQLNRRLIKKLQQRPELAVELLFSKISSTVFYLEYGYEKQTVSSNPRAPAELEVKGSMTKHEQIGIVVAALDEGRNDAIHWVKTVLSSAISERKSWEAEAEARKLLNENNERETSVSMPPSIFVKPDDEERQTAIYKNAKLRLLMTLVGFERLEVEDEPNVTWIIPSALTPAALEASHRSVEQHQLDPVMVYGEDFTSAQDMLVRKSAPRSSRRAEFDDDSEGGSDGEEDFLYPAGGPTARKSDALVELRKKRRKHRVDTEVDTEEALSEEASKARREARHLADLAKRQKIKSEVFVRDSDDEEDEERDREFFAREEELQKVNRNKILQALTASETKGGSRSKLGKRKKGNREITNDDDDDDDNDQERGGRRKRHKHSSPALPTDAESSSSSEEDDDLPIRNHRSSSPTPNPNQNHINPSDSNSNSSSTDTETPTPLSSLHSLSHSHSHSESTSTLRTETSEINMNLDLDGDVDADVDAEMEDEEEDEDEIITKNRYRHRHRRRAMALALLPFDLDDGDGDRDEI